jgi:hypothetical protein
MRPLMLVASALLAGLSCHPSDRVSCPPTEALASGTYLSKGDGTWNAAPPPFPHDNKQPKTLGLDLEAGRLVITYLRDDGQEVVETWRPRPGQGDWPTDAGTD